MIIEHLLPIKVATAAGLFLSVLPSDEASWWIPIVREIGSFGLVAFIVWWYATHVAPKAEQRAAESQAEARKDYLESAKIQRQDYLAAQQMQRQDYLKTCELDRDVLRELVAAVQSLTDEERKK